MKTVQKEGKFSMKSCPRCGSVIDIKTEFCTRCGLRVDSPTDANVSEEEYVPGIITAAKLKMEASAPPPEPAGDMTYPFVDRRKAPRIDVGKRESKMYDTKQGSQFYSVYQDPNYVPSILASAPPPPPPLEDAGVRSAFLSSSSVKSPPRGSAKGLTKKQEGHTRPGFKQPVEESEPLATFTPFKPLSEPAKSAPVRSPFKQVKPVTEEKKEEEAKVEAKKEETIPIWMRSKLIDFNDD